MLAHMCAAQRLWQKIGRYDPDFLLKLKMNSFVHNIFEHVHCRKPFGRIIDIPDHTNVNIVR